MIPEYPPIFHGTPEEQLAQMRAYLVRLVNYINDELREVKDDSSTNR